MPSPQAAMATLELLERSVRMRHKRLAVKRLSEAVALGADIPSEHWLYCRRVATESQDKFVSAMFMRAAQVAIQIQAEVDPEFETDVYSQVRN